MARGPVLGTGRVFAFTVAPGLGLPPEIPGSESGPLLARQLWWVATAGMTAGALALLAFTRRKLTAAAAVALLALPHLYGAPLPPADAAAAPPALARQFVVTVTVASFLFWAALGVATGYFYGRLGRRAAFSRVLGHNSPSPGGAALAAIRECGSARIATHGPLASAAVRRFCANRRGLLSSGPVQAARGNGRTSRRTG